MILIINNEICSNVEQFKGYFTHELKAGSTLYEDLLTYGRNGVISKWLRELREETLANKVESIADNGDADFIKKLGEVLTGEDMTNYISKRPFKHCFDYQNIECDVHGDDTIVKVTFKVITIANETYKVSLDNLYEHVEKNINPSKYKEGDNMTISFVLHKPFFDITIKAENELLYKENLTPIIAIEKILQGINDFVILTLLNLNSAIPDGLSNFKSGNLVLQKQENNIDNRLLDDAYRLAKKKLNEIQKSIKECPFHVYDAYDGVGSSDREKEEDIINKEIRPLAERGHKLASIDYYWYLFVRRYEDAEKFAKSYEANHKGEKLIETPLTDDQLYEKVQEMFIIISDKRSRSLSRTAWTGVHSTDINKGYDKEKELVFNKFIIPLIRKGHRKSCLDYYKKLLSEDKERARLFLNEYRSKHPGDKLIEHDTLDQIVGFQTDKIVKDLRENIVKAFFK